MNVTLWLTVAETTWHGRGEIWTRPLWTDQAPEPGAVVVLWPGDGNPGDGPLWTVDRRWWDADGAIHCQMARMVVDPDEEERQRLMADATGPRRDEARPWFAASDGRPEPGLASGGWRVFGGVGPAPVDD